MSLEHAATAPREELEAVVEQVGGVACHTGRASCFHQTAEGEVRDGYADPEAALGGTVRQKVAMQSGIPIDKAREIVKLVKELTGLGLKEAKDLVDAYIRSQPSLRQKLEQVQAEAWRKLKRGFIVALIFAAVIMAFGNTLAKA